MPVCTTVFLVRLIEIRNTVYPKYAFHLYG